MSSLATRRNSPCQVEKISRPVRGCAKKPGEQAEEADEKVERKTKYSAEYSVPKETKKKDELNCHKLAPRKDLKTFNLMNQIELGKFQEKALDRTAIVKRIAGRAVDCLVVSTTVAFQWAYAIFALQVRMKSLPGDKVFFRMPTDKELMNGPVRLARKRIENWTCRYMGRMEYCEKFAKRSMENAFANSTLIQRMNAEKKIEEIIKAGLRSQTLVAGNSRILVQINDDARMFVDSGIENAFKTMSNEMFYEHIEKNVVDEDDRVLVDAHRKLDRFSQAFDCNCRNSCTIDCPCATMDRAFYMGTIHDPESSRHYGCSEFCNCKGQCKKAFPKPPANSTEIVLHHQTAKGFALVAKQFFAPGEPVAEMRGEYCRTNTAPDLDNYIIDITVKDINNIYKAYFNDNRQSPKEVKALSPDYEKALQAVTKTGISLNPKNKSSNGRFASSSCLGNTKVNLVHERGVSPTNARVIFTATMPIFPTQEVTWFYSDQYIWEQFRKVCLCGELCCVKNKKLFPFITDAQLLKFYKNIYEAQLREFLNNIENQQAN
ncbi:Protein CBR-SET-20 [Caenorhabditis briggsae]|uniref:Protein CBR-SET-20 n=1 Tax=Caenorhabditis briggsae TaxID=6238 RepID=A8XKJ7_CAEBR|nr:Protein CBR-SET-20 [Caenorhabditis briggsae]CAP33171.2 Protein CBR-SET-20 [Caenorhabditis briggsae]